MNYVLQVVRGRSVTTTLRLAAGVTSLGRHDDCIIRIKSSQVSRKHCEVAEVDGRLMVRDLGSSNGTFVNGKRVLGQQALKVGDELTIGSVTLRVATLGQPAPPPSHPPAGKAGDTAVVEAVAVDDEEEFEIEFDEGDADPTADIEAIPLAEPDEAPAPPAPKKAPAAAEKAAPSPAAEKAAPAAAKGEDDAVAQFLLDLNLDEE